MSSKFRTIGFKLFIASAVIILVTALSVALLGYDQARRTIVSEAKRHILSIALERRARLQEWLNERRQLAVGMVAGSEILNCLESKGNAPSFHDDLQVATQLPGVTAIAVFDNDGVQRYLWGVDIADELHTEPSLPQHALQGESRYSPIHLNAAEVPAINLTAAIKNRRGDAIGALLLQFATGKTIDPILTDTLSLGSSGEAFLVDREMVMLTPSRFHEHPAPLTHKMPIPPVREAMQGASGSMVYTGFLGQEVVGAYASMPAYGWSVIAEMSTSEALAGLHMIVVNTLTMAAVALLVMLTIALILARHLTQPLERVAAASREVAAGDYSVRVTEERRRDEIGILIRMFNEMISGLEKSRDELQRSHERLLQSEKLSAIGRLAASIVHELRSPLSSVKMNVRLLGRESPPGSVESKHLELADREVKRMEVMLNELLDYSKPPTLNFTEVDPGSLAQQAALSVLEAAESQGVTVNYRIADPLPALCGDEELLLRALNNLLSNAVHACSKGGRVDLDIAPGAGDRLRIEVRDDGQGMNPRVLEHLFDPFFTTREDGVGLGMSNVKKIIEAHAGTIDVRSQESKGTDVILHLPIRSDHGDSACD